METAIELIWQSNYTNVGVADICKHAGVTKGSFYHYFETKADLFYEASMHHWDCKKSNLDEIFSPSYTSLEQLENLISYIIGKQECGQVEGGNPVSGCPIFTAGGQAGSGEEKVRAAAIEMSERAIKYDIALVKGLKADGYLNSDVDVEQTARMIFQYIMGLLIYGRVLHSLDAVKRDIRDAIYRLVDLKEEYRIQPNTMKK